MKRVLIVGCPGAGKSTLAKQLAKITDLPLVHLDRHYWLPGWQRPDRAAWERTIASLLSQSAWIMDGNYSGTLEHRLAAADTLIHLNYPTWLCVWRVIRRTAVGLGRNRDDELIPGCPERFDWSFLRFVIKYRKEQRERDLVLMGRFPGRVFRFTSPSRLSAFIAAIEPVADRRSREVTGAPAGDRFRSDSVV
ncbi:MULTISPECIES: adenylate kinase [Rhizobium/Agrobacterium group]|uniref:adenylate kinase n=1 Tax=Rhizobium/Agrobacterium group TaxID=227290 RepID=UPI0012E915A2|nr:MULTISPECIES: adenylate kinase [Rhizobium/Agrobacterium group]NSZ77363.1 adenylate kinase [Agrobacterium tumefaciens]MCR6727983.1 adenylate kinase [Agrobacterium fabrum]MVA53077.1 adenylate kinase [Agrobacterium vitis]MVA63239.1 adenylate kinase [Agrobacterium vitis]NTG45677.1 adenylate kinase [Rhizobium rhizogenes]